MAKGSHKTWGGWETRACHHCGRRITLQHSTAAHHQEAGIAFSLCADHIHLYAPTRHQLLNNVVHPNQLTLED